MPSEDLGDRKTVEQQALDPRTIEYTDKNQATAVHHFPNCEVATIWNRKEDIPSGYLT